MAAPGSSQLVRSLRAHEVADRLTRTWRKAVTREIALTGRPDRRGRSKHLLVIGLQLQRILPVKLDEALDLAAAADLRLNGSGPAAVKKCVSQARALAAYIVMPEHSHRPEGSSGDLTSLQEIDAVVAPLSLARAVEHRRTQLKGQRGGRPDRGLPALLAQAGRKDLLKVLEDVQRVIGLAAGGDHHADVALTLLRKRLRTKTPEL